jgi:hypothetical protein
LVAQGQIKGDSGESQGVCARVVNGEGSGYLNGPGAPPPTRHERQRPVGFVSPKRRPAGKATSLRFRTGSTRRRRVGPVALLGQKHDAGAPILAERTQSTVLAERTQKAPRLPCAGNLRRREAMPRPCDSAVPLSHPLGTGTLGQPAAPFHRSKPYHLERGTAGGRRKAVPCPVSLGTRDRNNIEE